MDININIQRISHSLLLSFSCPIFSLSLDLTIALFFRFIILPQILLNNNAVVDNNEDNNTVIPFQLEDIFTAKVCVPMRFAK